MASCRTNVNDFAGRDIGEGQGRIQRPTKAPLGYRLRILCGVEYSPTTHFMILQDAQELYLHRRRHVPDCVQEQRPALGRFEQAHVIV